MTKFIVNEHIKAEDYLKGKIAFPCSGNGTCGKCKIKITGTLSPLCSAERGLLTQDELDDNIRLACYVDILGSAEIEIFSQEQKVLGLADNISDTSDHGTICGIDIGTTTVACAIYSGANNSVLAQVLEENCQKTYGADVISRIEQCAELGVEVLQKDIRTQIQDMYTQALKSANIDSVDKIVITGNTTMLHILEGLDPASLGVAPFNTVSLFGTTSDFLGAYLPKCLGAYIGADLMCAAVSCNMTKSDKISLLVDIGTNGEMCLYKNDTLYCCSTAAGPAFEGCGLSCGSPAIDGAITHSCVSNGEVVIEHIGTEMHSICGSGILSLVSTMLELGIIDDTGRIEAENALLGTWDEDAEKYYIKGSDVYVSQKDIRSIQLAKSAICAGILTLLSHTDTPIEEVDTLYLCGGFGSHLNMSAASHIGLIPKELADCTVVLGNAALAGSVRIALGADEINCEKEEINLSSSSVFRDLYVDCMYFE